MAWTPKDSNLYQNDGFIYQTPFNTGVGNWFGNMDRWRSIGDGQRMTADDVKQIQDFNKNGVGDVLGNAWMDNSNPHGAQNQKLYDAMRSYTYRGADGKTYMIGGNYYHGGGGDQEGAHTAGDLMYGGVGALGHADKGRDIGEMSYSLTEFNGNPEDMGNYNGSMFDAYDKNGRYVGSQIPTSLGDDQFAKHAAMMAAMVFGGAAMAGLGAAGAAGGMGGSLGEGALAASGNFGLNAGTAGAAAANAGAVGAGTAGGLSGVGSEAGGHGAFVGEAPWTPTAGGGAMPGAGGGLVGVPPPANPAMGGGGLFGGGGSSGGMLSGEMFNIPGIGSVTGKDMLGIGSMLAGAVSGGQGQEQSQTQTRELPEWLQGPVVGGLVPQTNWLMQDQLHGPSTGLLTPSKSKKKKPRKGLL